MGVGGRGSYGRGRVDLVARPGQELQFRRGVGQHYNFHRDGC
jgi:hypothetical protein